MPDKIKKLSTAVLVTSASIGALIILARYRQTLTRKLFNLFSKDPLRNYNIHVINTQEECVSVAEKLKKDCLAYPVLGIDCEWVTVQGKRSPVALLQLCSNNGLCALIRLCNIRQIGPELKKLLEDEDILKVGVAPVEDAMKLSSDYGYEVAGALDLRYLAFEANLKAEGLAKMSKNFLNLELDKDWRVRASNWEAQNLKPKQVEYAVLDVIAAVELFKFITSKIKKQHFWTSDRNYLMSNWNTFNKYSEIPYRELVVGKTAVPVPGSSTPQIMKKPHEFKRFKSSTRQTPLYDNCVMEAPDGEVLCTCDKSKAMWYVSKGLATMITEEPLRIRLTFEPAGRAVGSVGKYYTIAKENHCVVCGKKEDFIRKNVVPREYRKFFPEVMKDHTSHDVLLLCTLCHQLSNMSDLKLRYKLSELCDAPLQSQENTRLVEVPDLKKLKSAARALYKNGHRLPDERKKVLEREFLEHFSAGTELTDELLQEYQDIEVHKENLNYFQHGQKVVQHFIENEGIIQLEKMWREHFVTAMRPEFLPELWSVDHNQHRLEIRADEGRVNECDLIAAGVDLKN